VPDCQHPAFDTGRVSDFAKGHHVSTPFDWDVFLSHSTTDKPRVARLAERLQGEGFRVWFDRATIDGGDDIVTAIEQGLDRSRVLVLCMTKAAFESEWVRLERNTATFRDPAYNDRRFLPLRFDDCQIPATLRRLKYIDWRAESDDAWQQLLATLQPGAARLLEVPRDEWNPFDPYTPALGSSFVGRTDELRRMQQAMETGHSLSVVGDWRIGKTSLLATFAERARESGRGVRQLTGEGPEGGSVSQFVTQVTGRAASDDTESAADQLSEWAAANARGGMRPVLIVDEVERLVIDFPPRFLERIRGMLERVMVVLCSRRELDLVYQDRGLTSPFNNTLELVRVALLDDPALESLLNESTDILTAEDMSAVREWAGRHPYFVQLYGHELADARLNHVSTDDAFDRFYDTAAARFRELWSVLADQDREELRKSVSDIPTTRRTLRQRGLVTSDGKPFGRILREWIQEEKP
jgi:hypothetical protein